MELQTLITIIVVMLFVFAYYSTNSKRNKILCRYMGQDKTIEEKWLGADRGYVIFRKRKFYVDTRRIASFWLTKGIHALFPTKVNYLEYSWHSCYPHDPDNYTNVWETPEVRDAINASELVTSYFRTATPSAVKKQGMLQAYLPFIAIIAVVLLGFWTYSNFQGISHTLAAIQNSLNAITK